MAIEITWRRKRVNDNVDDNDDDDDGDDGGDDDDDGVDVLNGW